MLLVFGELEDLDIDWLCREGQVVHQQPGEAVIAQGSALDRLWVVLQDADVFLLNDEQRQQVGSSARRTARKWPC